jgi:hypothetical protein
MNTNINKIWLPVPDFENKYEISIYGNIRNINTGRLMKLSKISNESYFYVGLSKNGKQTHFYVHRLVLLTFIGEPKKGFICCHNDGNGLNNKLENLRWDTTFSNSMDKSNHKNGIKKPMGWNGFIISVLKELLKEKK